MKVAFGQLMQEVNHFSPVSTTLKEFEHFGIRYGEDLADSYAGGGEFAGFHQVAQAEGDLELVPVMAAWAMPAGKLDAQTHQFLRARMLEGLRKAGRVDGILLALHGAMSAEDEQDIEGALLESVRREWGNGVPIVVTLDHHANITAGLVRSADALVGYHTEPHVDALETGRKAAEILVGILRGEIRPTVGWRKLPMIATGNLLAPEGPLGEFFAEAEELESRGDVLAVSIFPEFPYSDTPELGWSVVVVTNDSPELAQSIADRLAKAIWDRRHEFLPEERPSASEAVRYALSREGGPFVLGDYGDNTVGGATGDSTVVLRELLALEFEGKALVSVVDPEAVERCVDAGVGAVISLEVGGKIDRLHYQPVQVTGQVNTLRDGRYRVWNDMDASMGRAAVLEVGNVDVLLSELASPNVGPNYYRSVGLNPEKAKIVLVKCAYNFREYYGPLAEEMIVVDSPGVTWQDLRARADEFKIAPRPLFPLDEGVQFDL